MNLCEISFKVKSGSYKLFDSERTKSSSVWNTFKLVKNDKDEIIFGVACCIKFKFHYFSEFIIF